MSSSLPRGARRPSPPNPGSQNPHITPSKIQGATNGDSQGHSRPNSIGGVSEGIGNLNRWSQSTTSSKSSVTNQQRRNSFARRLSGSFGSMGGHKSSQSPTNTKNVFKKANPAPTGSPRRTLRENLPKPQNLAKPGRLPPLVTLPMLSQAVEAAHTPLSADTATSSATDLLPSATYMPGNDAFFGDSWTQVPNPNQSSAGMPGSALPHSSDNQLGYRIKPGANNSFTVSYSNHTDLPQLQTQPFHSDHRDQDSSLTPFSQRTKRSSNGGMGTGNGDLGDQRDKGRRRKAPSQKAMLSKALQKANQAVVLDNAQNFEGAMDAYGDACDLLKQVMLRSSGDEDKKKLDAIRNTYTNRIKELQANELLTQSSNDKALPDVPINVGYKESEPFSPITDDEEDAETSTTAAMYARVDQSTISDQSLSMTLTRDQLPPRRQSLMPMPPSDDPLSIRWKVEDQSPRRQGLQQRQTSENVNSLMEREYMPPPLSPRRPRSPALLEKSERPSAKPQVPEPSHSRHITAESTSWLDTIDESGGSSSSSVHSKTSSIGLRRKHIRTGSGATEAEFDAALDAAVEAAYDDGYEPASDADERYNYDKSTTFVSNARRNVDIAKQRVREAEREAAILMAKEREKRRRLEHGGQELRDEGLEWDYEDHEAVEEERMLEDMTKDFILADTTYDTRGLPRQSDSSGFSGRTLGSSSGSMPTTGSGVGSSIPLIPNSQGQSKIPPIPPPSTALPPPPLGAVPTTTHPPPVPKSTGDIVVSPGVRDRRLSGQNVKRLKIDTSARLPSTQTAPKTQAPPRLPPVVLANSTSDAPKSAPLAIETPRETSDIVLQQTNLLNGSRQVSLASGVTEAVPSHTTISNKARNPDPLMPTSPVRSTAKGTGTETLRKNFSSSSLKHLVSGLPPAADESPGTPIKRVFSASSVLVRNGSLPVVPDLPTPSATTLAKHGLANGSISFLDSDIQSPNSSAPVPLEPCPESFLLRPFWLMRAIYQTIAHPRGGYISTRLFVPRDAWRVKNVKLKNVDEKVSNCDLLTAALLNLSKVDTLDADAMLEEMQAFELVLDQVQGQLGKKLGTEVGVSGSAAIFASKLDETGSTLEVLGSKSTNSRYLSWRKLRPKNSNPPGLPSGQKVQDSVRETLTMRSLPMTSAMNPKFPKRDSAKVLGIGPHSHYMAALGRLCDAVQILDQIARQVEDPGLRLTSQTHVGLELCTRHAAEFFAFFVCRFALTDIGMMLDKYVKRGSEWVMT